MLGAMPQGLPHFVLPRISPAEMGAVIIGGIEIALVSFTDTSILSRTFAVKTKTYVDPNQEMVGSVPPILPRACFRGFQSAAAPRARPSPRHREHARR